MATFDGPKAAPTRRANTTAEGICLKPAQTSPPMRNSEAATLTLLCLHTSAKAARSIGGSMAHIETRILERTCHLKFRGIHSVAPAFPLSVAPAAPAHPPAPKKQPQGDLFAPFSSLGGKCRLQARPASKPRRQHASWRARARTRAGRRSLSPARSARSQAARCVRLWSEGGALLGKLKPQTDSALQARLACRVSPPHSISTRKCHGPIRHLLFENDGTGSTPMALRRR